uniref:Secreted protein n=1 Tax=Heterorhabditis bacteriophora TaxID=37862 RepID=A0A1I7XUE9_HETBA
MVSVFTYFYMICLQSNSGYKMVSDGNYGRSHSPDLRQMRLDAEMARQRREIERDLSKLEKMVNCMMLKLY